MTATLTLFQVTGEYRAVVAPILSGSTNTPQITIISASVDFIPRLPIGFMAYVDDYDGIGDTAIALPTIPARITEGVLSTIDIYDAPGVGLVANTGILGIDQLIYDVRFSNAVYAKNNQTLQNFAFIAPTSDETICLTDPALDRLPYQAQGRRYT